MKSFEPKGIAKWLPVIFAVITAGCQAINEQKEKARLNDMEDRIAKLEQGKQESE